MNSELLNVSPRIPQIKAKKLRRQGYVPGVLYGYNHTTYPVIFERKSVEGFVQRIGTSAIFEVSLDGEIQPVRIREIQKDPITHEIIHMDLQSIQMDKKIKTSIPLRFDGKQMVEKSGYIIQHQKDSIEVEGFAKDIPSHISVPLNILQNKQSIRVQDLEIAEEISIINAPNDIIALVVRPAREIVNIEITGIINNAESKPQASL